MSADLRQLMRELADDAPAMHDRGAMADVAYTGGRRRRRIRHLEITGATTVVMLCALLATLFVGTSPLAARYGASSATSVSGYPKEIGRQWPVLDLPAKPGPIAALILTESGWQAVSPTGHRWKVPFVADYTPALSADGRYIGYLQDPDQNDSPYAVSDLVTGRVIEFNDVGSPIGDAGRPYQVAGQSPLYFSPDDRYLAVSGFSPTGGVVVMDLQKGKAVPGITSRGHVVGWSGSRLVISSGAGIQQLSARDGFRSVVAHAAFHPLISGGNQFSGQVSDDGKTLGYLIGDDKPERLYRYDVATGLLLGSQALPAQVGYGSFVFSGNQVTYQREKSPLEFDLELTSIGIDGRQRVIPIHPSLQSYGPVLASHAFQGSARSPLLVDRVEQLVAPWWLAVLLIAIGVIAIGVVALLVTRRTRTRRSRYAEWRNQLDIPESARSSRRPVGLIVVGGGVLLVLVAMLAVWLLRPRLQPPPRVVGPTVALPDTPSDLSTGGAEGNPALVLVVRGHQEGFAIEVHNPGGRAIAISGRDDSWPTTLMDSAGNGLGISTSAGPASAVRDLTYQASGSIPAHQSRWLRMLFRTCGQSSASQILSGVTIHFTVGGHDRSALLPLNPVLKVTGPAKPLPSDATCTG